MKKQLFGVVMVVAALVLGGSAAYAQAPVSTVDVPFRFVVGETMMPAGSYTVTTIGEGLNVLCIRSVDSKSVASVIVNLAESSAEPASTEFRFAKIGGQHFLSQVSAPGVLARVIPLPAERVDAVMAKLNGAKAPRPGRPTVLR